MSRQEVTRAVVRGVVASIGLALLSNLDPTWSLRLPPASAAYAGLLVFPSALLESRLGEDVCVLRRALAAAAIASIAFVAACAAHGQAVYAAGVLEVGALEGGFAAVQFEWVRLQRPVEYVGPLWLLYAGAAGALAVALACSTVTLPLVVRRADGWTGRIAPVGGMAWAGATVIVSVAISEALAAAHADHLEWTRAAEWVGASSLGPLLVMVVAWRVATWLVRDLDRSPPDESVVDP